MDAIFEYVADNDLKIYSVNLDNTGQVEKLDRPSLKKILLPDFYLAEVSDKYLLFSALEIDEFFAIGKVVELIEDGEINDAFVLIDYFDDDKISISYKKLPFQHSTSRADWWKPNT
eukprot:CAMPEP_0195254026 /NCGR_PEP_ID=MMETSP0706-20130129/4817_1 /TAXON_ID=33640 /ORGANISM="Asterionellopsis glacialis, Strain CCMP134" /LENGTH=115 /DNA_ID=CAMNT_0040306643 /DNA_START=163 /DNA_END=510 /DNA_ORIENTATION=+